MSSARALADSRDLKHLDRLSQTFVAKGQATGQEERRMKDQRNKKLMENRPVPGEKEVATSDIFFSVLVCPFSVFSHLFSASVRHLFPDHIKQEQNAIVRKQFW
jgi:hypothetical protein